MSGAERIDLTRQDWTLTGWRPQAWRLKRPPQADGSDEPEIGPVPARLPGSVQRALREAELVPDWNVGTQSRQVEWVEHRHWMFSTTIELDSTTFGEWWLEAEVLDHAGWILVDGQIVGRFSGSQVPTELNLSAALRKGRVHQLAIVFDLPPEEQGQTGFTSRSTHFKPRFQYGWDWCPRLVSIGTAGWLRLVDRSRHAVVVQKVSTELDRVANVGAVVVAMQLRPSVTPRDFELVVVELWRSGRMVERKRVTADRGDLRVRLMITRPDWWWPNGEGEPALYELRVGDEHTSDRFDRREVGFKEVRWEACEDAPQGALPWICVINGRPVFLQGVNWTPPRLSYLDVTEADLETLLGGYHDMGCNLLRVWGGARLESAAFYARCDRLGLLVWQEFPLCSSGLENEPPRRRSALASLRAIVIHALTARRHHACLLLWCGGNELTDSEGRPCSGEEDALRVLAELVAERDAGRRFLPTSPFGPSFVGNPARGGRGHHHVVHGPWGFEGLDSYADWEAYWAQDDALFRAEVGVPSASSRAVLQRYGRGEEVWPPQSDWWRHTAAWWTQWHRLASELSAEPGEIPDAYIERTQREQAEALAWAATCTKRRFPACGGFLVWMGHDSFPCPANTALIDFLRRPKPAVAALSRVFKTAPALLADASAEPTLNPELESSPCPNP